MLETTQPTNPNNLEQYGITDALLHDPLLANIELDLTKLATIGKVYNLQQTPLTAAWQLLALSGNALALKNWLTPNPNEAQRADRYRRNIAHYAAMSGNPDALHLAINLGVSITLADNQAYTPLHYAHKDKALQPAAKAYWKILEGEKNATYASYAQEYYQNRANYYGNHPENETINLIRKSAIYEGSQAALENEGAKNSFAMAFTEDKATFYNYLKTMLNSKSLLDKDPNAQSYYKDVVKVITGKLYPIVEKVDDYETCLALSNYYQQNSSSAAQYYQQRAQNILAQQNTAQPDNTKTAQI